MHINKGSISTKEFLQEKAVSSQYLVKLNGMATILDFMQTEHISTNVQLWFTASTLSRISMKPLKLCLV